MRRNREALFNRRRFHYESSLIDGYKVKTSRGGANEKQRVGGPEASLREVGFSHPGWNYS